MASNLNRIFRLATKGTRRTRKAWARTTARWYPEYGCIVCGFDTRINPHPWSPSRDYRTFDIRFGQLPE